jgi:hypothetical protein
MILSGFIEESEALSGNFTGLHHFFPGIHRQEFRPSFYHLQKE